MLSQEKNGRNARCAKVSRSSINAVDSLYGRSSSPEASMMATMMALQTTNDLMTSHRQSALLDMGIVTELASTKTDEGDEPASPPPSPLRSLLEHFYPKHELDSPKFISLIRHNEEEEEKGERLDEQYVWERDPKNWTNCALVAFAELESYAHSFPSLGKEQLGVVMPIAFKIADSHQVEHRRRAMQFAEWFYEIGDVKFLLHANTHRVLMESVLTSLTFNDHELVRASYVFAVRILSFIEDCPGERLHICDSLVERSLFCLSHSSSAAERLHHWQGLHSVVQQMGVAFVRHFHRFFKTCEVLSFGVNTSAELDCLLAVFETVERMLPERYALRLAQVDAIKRQCRAAFHGM